MTTEVTTTTTAAAVLQPAALIQSASADEVRRQRLQTLFSMTTDEVLQLFALSAGVRQNSRATYVRSLRQFFTWLSASNRQLFGLTSSGEVVPTVTTADLNSYVDDLTEAGKQPTTVNGYIIAVRQFFLFLDTEFGLHFSIGKVRAPHTEKEFSKRHLTEQQVERMLNKLKRQKNVRDFAMVNLMLRTGLRTVEVVRLDVNDITIEGGQRILRIWGKKRSRKDDFVVLSDKAYSPIKAYLQTRKNVKPFDPLFVSSSNRDSGQRMTTRSVSRIAKNALTAVGIDTPEYTAHSLRHTTAVLLRHAGASLEDVQQVLRHASINTTRLYNKSDERAQRIAAATESKLDKIF